MKSVISTGKSRIWYRLASASNGFEGQRAFGFYNVEDGVFPNRET